MAMKRRAIGFRHEDLTDKLIELMKDEDADYTDATCSECGEAARIYIYGGVHAAMGDMEEAAFIDDVDAQDVLQGATPCCTRCALREAPEPMQEVLRDAHERVGLDTTPAVQEG